MPIDYRKYPNNWKTIRAKIVKRADGRCELCNAENYKPHWKTGSRVILTVAHIDQDTLNNKDYNLLALCQRCHLKIDMPYKIEKRELNKKGVKEMSITLKAVKAKLLEELRLDIYLANSFGSNNHYEQGRQDTTRNHLVLLGCDKAKLMKVKDIDKLLGVGK